MMRPGYLCFAGLAVCAALLAACAHAPAGDGKQAEAATSAAVPLDAIIPAPAQVERAADGAAMRIAATTTVDACGDEAQKVARYFVDLVQRTRGLALPVGCAAKKPAQGIRFVFHADRDAIDGAYKLDARIHQHALPL